MERMPKWKNWILAGMLGSFLMRWVRDAQGDEADRA